MDQRKKRDGMSANSRTIGMRTECPLQSYLLFEVFAGVAGEGSGFPGLSLINKGA